MVFVLKNAAALAFAVSALMCADEVAVKSRESYIYIQVLSISNVLYGVAIALANV